ncbi:MAG TPA: 2-dehydropantoate 2-reductase [Candidatus Binatia bacterium]|nr:2-dehydropantoate 2-reductase [Candidatus Binatia bacterium]
MRIAVMGVGAVGGYFGARLSAASNEVAFIARGLHGAALRQEGLILESAQGNLNIRNALVAEDPAEVGVVDLVVFCVKSYDTESAAAKITPLMGDGTIILSLQNGVDNADKIVQRWGEEKTLAGVVYVGSQLLQPGMIRHSSGGKIIFGELGGQVHEPTRAIEQVLSSAKIPCEVSREIRAIQWRKLLWNAPFCAISCLTGATVKAIVESDSLTKLARDCMTEVQAAAKTQGIDLDSALFDETLHFSRSLGDFKPSMLQDLEAQKPLEYEAFNGIVVDILLKAGREAPTNQVFYGALKYLDERIRAQKSTGES